MTGDLTPGCWVVFVDNFHRHSPPYSVGQVSSCEDNWVFVLYDKTRFRSFPETDVRGVFPDEYSANVGLEVAKRLRLECIEQKAKLEKRYSTKVRRELRRVAQIASEVTQ